MEDDHRRLLTYLANLPEGSAPTLKWASDTWRIAVAYLRDAFGDLEDEGFVVIDGTGLMATVAITATGRHALMAALQHYVGHGAINVHGGNVQIGTENAQYFADSDEDEDEDEDEDDDEEGEGDEDGDDDEESEDDDEDDEYE